MNRAEAGRLLARYFDGELSDNEQQQLMKAMVADQDLYNAFSEELLLKEMLQDPEFRARVAAAVQPVPRRAGRIVQFIRSLNAGWQLAGAAAAVALLLVCALVFYRANRHEENTVTHAPNLPVAPRQAPIPTLLTVVLMPAERNSGAVQKIALGDNQTVRLLMNLGEGSYASYRAVLASADTPFKREFDGLKPIRSDGGARQLELEFPSSLLQAGDYTVTLSGLTAAGAEEPAAGYSFSVVRKK